MSSSPDFQAILRVVDEIIDCRSLLRDTDLAAEERAQLESVIAAGAAKIRAYLQSLDP